MSIWICRCRTNERWNKKLLLKPQIWCLFCNYILLWIYTIYMLFWIAILSCWLDKRWGCLIRPWSFSIDVSLFPDILYSKHILFLSKCLHDSSGFHWTAATFSCCQEIIWPPSLLTSFHRDTHGLHYSHSGARLDGLPRVRVQWQ